jgi:ADP-ribose pyrophosphatase
MTLAAKYEETMSSEYPFIGRLIKVRVDEVRLPNGRLTRREVVEHRGAVAIVALEGGNVLLERQYRHTAGKVLWEIPAGTLEVDEIPRDCAIRELREETGYAAQRMEEMTHFYVAIGYSSEIIRIFIATGLSKEKATPEEDESIETVMVPLAEALEMVMKNEIEDAKSMIGILLANDFGKIKTAEPL